MKDDVIFLKDLEVDCIIGVNDWERMVEQTVRISYEIPTDIRPAAKTDEIDDAVNYKAISKWIISFVEESEFFLVEKLIEEVARGCLKNFDIDEITLTIEKPGAVRHSKSVGVTITRRADEI